MAEGPAASSAVTFSIGERFKTFTDLENKFKWGAKNFTNICTLDNFVTTLLLYCKQHPDFLIKAIGNSDSEDVHKTGLKLMLGGDLVEGRTQKLNSGAISTSMIAMVMSILTFFLSSRTFQL